MNSASRLTSLGMRSLCGFAAAQCGKAPPYRYSLTFFEAAPHKPNGGAASWLPLFNSTVRPSLTALCGGEAAHANCEPNVSYS